MNKPSSPPSSPIMAAKTTTSTQSYFPFIPTLSSTTSQQPISTPSSSFGSIDQSITSPMTRLTILKGPCSKRFSENEIRRSISFGFVASPNLNLNQHSQSQSQRREDRPRVITNRKSESQTENEFVNSLDQSTSSPPVSNHYHHHHHHSLPHHHYQHHHHHHHEPLNLKSIPSEILLPFNQREIEIIDLLTHDRNLGLYNRLCHLLEPNWPTFESETLRADRSRMDDREWIESIKTTIEPLDNNLWVSFRGLIGADGLDHHQLQHQHQLSLDSTENDWFIQPVRVRRSSTRSFESRRRIALGSHHRSSSDSFVSVFGESDQETSSAISQSPRAVMESIKEQEGSELENPPNLDSSPILRQTCFDSGDDLDDPSSHPLCLKILDRSPCYPFESSPEPKNLDYSPSHGLKYTFGEVLPPALKLPS